MGIKKWVVNWIRKAVEEEQKTGKEIGYVNQVVRADSDIGSNNKVRFSLMKAQGGYVVEANSYDSRTDRSNNTVYVFGDEANIGEEIGRVVTMEAMRL